jgi:hypothetical protein
MKRRSVDHGHAPAGARLAAASCAMPLGALLLLVLAGCASTSDSSFTVFADPGKYTYYSCDQISTQTKIWTKREQDLRALMDKAEQSAGGAVVNVLAYQADYVAATEELRVLEKTSRNKNCNPPPPAWGSDSAIR